MEDTIKKTVVKAQKASTKTTKATKSVANIKAKKETKDNSSTELYPITLNKQEVKRVIDMFVGTKNTPKTPVNKIAEILKINKKQVFRVLHKNNLKTYKESSLK